MAHARSVNFSESEKSRLLNLVQAYKSVIENKKTDSANIKMKSNVWEELAVSFNALGGSARRSTQQLKICYANMKQRSKEKKIPKRFDKVESSRTSRCSSLLDISPPELCITSMAEDQLHPHDNPVDSDAMYIDDVDEVNFHRGAIIELPETVTYIGGGGQPKFKRINHPTQPINELAAPQSTTSVATIYPLPPTPSSSTPSRKRRRRRRDEEAADRADNKAKVLSRHLEIVNEQHSIKMKILQNELESSKLALENQKLENKIKRANLLKLLA